MKMKKILALVLALMLTISAVAFAETAAEEEAVEHDYEVITDPVVATVGDVEIKVSDCMTRFMNYYETLSQYSNYGIDVNSYLTSIKKAVMSEMVQLEIESRKIAELGYDQFTEEEMAEITADAEATYNEIYLYYYDYFTYNSEQGADVGAMTTEYLEQYGYGKEAVLTLAKNSFATDKMVADLTKDITVSEADLASYYDSCVTADQDSYSLNFSLYEEARLVGNDTAICYNPEGYRQVLQVLIAFDDETKAKYAELQGQLDLLLDPETAPEDKPEVTVDEVKAQMKELTAPLMETAAEVTEKFNNGASIDELIAEYNDDPGMTSEGYYVNSQSISYDSAFVDAAFSVSKPGQLSAPYAGMYGLYMVYYLNEIPAGPVALEEVRDVLEPECYDILVREAYYAKLNEWREELNVTTNIDMFITGYES